MALLFGIGAIQAGAIRTMAQLHKHPFFAMKEMQQGAQTSTTINLDVQTNVDLIRIKSSLLNKVFEIILSTKVF